MMGWRWGEAGTASLQASALHGAHRPRLVPITPRAHKVLGVHARAVRHEQLAHARLALVQRQRQGRDARLHECQAARRVVSAE